MSIIVHGLGRPDKIRIRQQRRIFVPSAHHLLSVTQLLGRTNSTHRASVVPSRMSGGYLATTIVTPVERLDPRTTLVHVRALNRIADPVSPEYYSY